MGREKGVVVTYHHAGFWAEFVDRGAKMCEKGEFRTEIHDVEDVGVVIEGV